MDARWARPWFGLTALLVLVEIVSTMVVTAGDDSAFGGSPINRALNIFAFFTIQSNVLVGVVCLLLAIRMNRTSTVFAFFRLTGLASNWYPYPFADAHALGYLRVIINGLWVSLLFLGLAAGAHLLDRKLQRPARSDVQSAA